MLFADLCVRHKILLGCGNKAHSKAGGLHITVVIRWDRIRPLDVGPRDLLLFELVSLVVAALGLVASHAQWEFRRPGCSRLRADRGLRTAVTGRSNSPP